MVSAGVMGSNFLTVNPSTETSNVESSEPKASSFEKFIKSAKTDAKTETDIGSIKSDKSEEIKNLFEKSNVTQGTTSDKITEEQIVEATEDAITDLIKNVIEIVSEVMEIEKKDVEVAIKDLDLSADALLNKNGLSELMKQLAGKDNAVELLTNSELSDMFKNIVEQVDDITKLFMETNSVNKEQLMEMVAEIDIDVIMPEENVDDVIIPNEVEPKVEVEYQIKEDEQTEVKQVTKENDTIVEADITKNAIEFNQTSDNKSNDMTQNNHTLAQNFTENLINAVEELNVDMDMDIEPQQVIRQIVDEVRVSVNENVRSLEMQLNPESLGKLNLQLVSKNGEVTANIIAQTETAKEIIESQITMLKENLLEQGVKVEAVEVTVANRGFDEDFDNQERAKDEQKQKRHISQKELDEINGVQSVQDIIEEEMMKQNGNTVSIKV